MSVAALSLAPVHQSYLLQARRYGVQGIPLLVLFRGGSEADRLVGAVPLEQLRTWLEPHLEPASAPGVPQAIRVSERLGQACRPPGRRNASRRPRPTPGGAADH
jgi:hypothetical protein